VREKTKQSIPLGTYERAWWERLLGRRPQRYALPSTQLKAHFHVIGVSGSGKSRFLAHLYLSLLANGLPATLIDHHGELAELVLASLVAKGTYRRRQAGAPDPFERVIYLDVQAGADGNRYLPFNVLNQPHLSHDIIASNVKEAFHRAWPELSEGAAAFDTILPDVVLVLLHHKLPLTCIQRLLIDADWRAQLLADICDEDLAASFRHVYDQLKKPDQLTYAGSVLRRARQLTMIRVLKHGLAQPEMLLDFRRIMDAQQSVILNLSRLQDDARRLIGCFLTVGAEYGAKSRPLGSPGTHHLLMDEFQNYSTHSGTTLAHILSETRKFNLFAVLAHQTWGQLDSRLISGLQNVGVEVTFKLGHQDAHQSAGIIGEVDPLAVKHEAKDPAAQERGHPVYFSLQEQWERWAQSIKNLRPSSPTRPGEAFITLRHGTSERISAMWMPDPAVDAGELAAVKDEYLRRYFKAPSDSEGTAANGHIPPVKRFRATMRTEPLAADRA
jgi:hypothetical protein